MRKTHGSQFCYIIGRQIIICLRNGHWYTQSWSDACCFVWSCDLSLWWSPEYRFDFVSSSLIKLVRLLYSRLPVLLQPRSNSITDTSQYQVFAISEAVFEFINCVRNGTTSLENLSDSKSGNIVKVASLEVFCFISHYCLIYVKRKAKSIVSHLAAASWVVECLLCQLLFLLRYFKCSEFEEWVLSLVKKASFSLILFWSILTAWSGIPSKCY